MEKLPAKQERKEHCCQYLCVKRNSFSDYISRDMEEAAAKKN